MRVRNALPIFLVRRSVTPVALALIFAVSWSVSSADTQTQKQREAKARREAKKHEVKPREGTKHAAVKHPNAHPEAHAKQHEAEAKKRRGEDKKRESKAKRDEAKVKKEHPSALETRPGRGTSPNPTHRDKPAMDGAPDTPGGSVTSQDQDVARPAEATTGVSNPPPDPPRAEAAPAVVLPAGPSIVPALYTKRGRLVVPPPLKGSHEILVRQNQMADDEGLDRIRDDADLGRMRRAGLLVPLPASSKLYVDERLPADRRYCRPWAALFLEDMAREFYARFGEALQVNSAVRTAEFQQRLMHSNGNAAPAEGDSASPHLTGQAVDIGKRGLSLAEIAWLRWYLLTLVQAEKVDVEEEFQQACFHISVYKSYLPRAGRSEVAAVRRGGMSALATGLR